MKTRLITFLMSFFFLCTVSAHNIIINKKDGTTEQVAYSYKTLLNKGIQNNNGSIISFTEINAISTSDYETYEKIFRKTQRRASHIEVEFTGDMNAYSARLEKLKRNRDGADVASGIGGVMSIIGVLSGDRQLTAAGIAVNGAGRIARDINQDRTMDTQTAMLNELDKRTTAEENASESEELSLRNTYGDDNVNALKELLDNNHEKALAYVNVASLSKDANHRVSAMWLKAMVLKDQGSTAESKHVFEQLVLLDPEMKDINQVEQETTTLLQEVEKLR
ncbi:hypothetical protein [Cognatitamlana onchidii]|uniref:hypothetical protein n=1 Tax=Cognatitamlana onchidii TaxID=2562860 RepID=UPI0010A61BCD|nr:hypothetical protein [Algibacter onchidii]